MVMKRILLYAIAFLGLSFTISDLSHDTTVQISDGSRLVISGNTNINRFKCGLNIAQITAPIPVDYAKRDGKIFFNKAVLPLYSGYFDCGGRAINKDFRALLKAGEHPKIYLRLQELELGSPEDHDLNAKVSIEIAGVEKSYQIPIRQQGAKNLCVTGKLLLNISDFGLEPPKKAFGLIVISDNIEINFDLILEET